MMKIDENGLRLCRFQGELFEKSVSKVEASTPIFLRRFMYSSVAERMDRKGFLFESASVNTVFGEIELEFGRTTYGKNKFGCNELYWMGYLYRYWCYLYGKTSKQVYRIIKPEELRKLYFAYHSLDPAQAIERILEAKGLGEEDFTKRGVEIYRRILREKGRL